MYYNDITEAKDFMEDFSQKSYVDIFNIRSRVEQREWERKAIKDVKKIVYQEKNEFPTNKNVLYIHIPFCATRCDYCPYYTSAYNQSKMNDYLTCVEKEIDSIKDTPFLRSTQFSSMYFGGGTPSILSAEDIKRILTKIYSSFQFLPEAELSFESNPSTLTEEKIRVLKENGINRVSLGIQTFNDRLLKEMNCAHTAKSAKKVINMLMNYDILVNIDMIYGLVGQSLDEFQEDLVELKGFQKPHQITLFPLRIAENTPLGELLAEKEGISIKKHTTRLLDYDRLAEDYLLANSFMREESPVFYHKEGCHKHKYHSTETRVIGIGSSAGTLLDGGESSNFYDVNEYMDAVKQDNSTALSGILLNKRQAYERFVLYRVLYMNRSLPDFKKIVEEGFLDFYHVPMGDVYDNVIENMKRLRFITMDEENGKIILTDRLWRVLNKVKIGMPSIL